MKWEPLGMLFVMMLFIAGPVFALQEYAGNFVVEVYNGSVNSSEYSWVINDENEPINVSVALNCRDGSSDCDFLKYVNVSPMRFQLPPKSSGKITVTAGIPWDYEVGKNFSGMMFGRKETVQAGQVTIQLQVGKIIEVRTLLSITPEKTEIYAQAAPAQKPPTSIEILFGASSPFLLFVMVVLLIALAVAIMGKKKEHPKKQKYKK